MPTYSYTGPINTDPVIVIDGTTLTDGRGRDFPDLASLYPDEAVFTQCSYIMTNPPPVFLTPVNSIKLPQSTLPKTNNPATPTPTSPTTSPSTVAEPATPPIVVPSPTTTQRPPTTTAAAPPPEESDNPPSSPPPNDDNEDDDEDPPPSPPDDNDDDENEDGNPIPSLPQETDDASNPAPPSDNDDEEDEDPAPSPPQESENPSNPAPPIENDDGEDENTAPSPPQESDSSSNPSPPSDNDDGEDESPAPSPNPGTSAGSPQPPSDAPAPTSQPANPDPSPSQGQPDAPANPPSPSNDGEPARPSTNLPNESDNESGVPGNTAAPTTRTQPSGNAPIAPVTVTAPGSSTTPILGLPSSSPSDEDNEGSPEIIVGGSTTIVAGGGVAVGSGTTFSVLPSSSGIIGVADGSTRTLALPTVVPSAGGDSAPPVLEVPASTPEGVVVGGSTTIVAGGGVAVGSGTTFSVLPSSSGIVAIADGSTSTLPLPTFVSSADAPQGVVVGGSTTIVAGGGAAVGSGTTFSVLPSSGGIIAIADGRTSTLSLPTKAPSANDGFVHPITSAAPGFVLPGQTVSEGGEAAVVGGTSFSALPSGSGVVAISEGGSTILQPSQLSDFGISTVADNPDAFVLPSQTLAVGGSAAAIDGTTYSALPGGSGINVASDGQTSTIAAAEATNVPGVGEITLIGDASSDGYVLDGSVTVLPGGADATVSGTVYTALPSGFGVLVSSDSDDFAAYIEQGLQGSDDGKSYIVGVESLSAGQATTVSGVVYSVLPSGSGVLVVANGQSTTLEIGPTPTGDNSEDEGSAATATGGPIADESVVPSEGGSAPQHSGLGTLAWIAYLSVLGAVGACLVL